MVKLFSRRQGAAARPGGEGTAGGGGGRAGAQPNPAIGPAQRPRGNGICRWLKYGSSGGQNGGGVIFSGGMTIGVGESTSGGDRGEEERKLPSSEQDEAASEQGRLGSGDSVDSVLVSVSTFFRLHFDCPHARNPFAKGLLSIFNFVMRSFCGQGELALATSCGKVKWKNLRELSTCMGEGQKFAPAR